jgi:hypothetical protein
MAKKCEGRAARDVRCIAGFRDEDLLRGVRSHADPAWWNREDIRRSNKATLRRWGTYLRLECRRRGLI